MARNRTPTAVLEANRAYDTHPERRRRDEPKPAGVLGAPPEWLDAREQAIWRELEEQVPSNVLSIADRILVEMTCKLLAEFRAGGRLVKDEHGEHIVPMKAADRTQLLRCLSLMGLTPADRARLSTPKPEAPGNEFDELANQRRPGKPAGDDDDERVQ